MMYKIAINRPITVLMFFVALIIFGLISAFSMSVNLFPSVNVPIIKVSTKLSGDLKYIESKVTKEIENALSDIDGIKTISSSSFDNFTVTVMEFELDKDLEVAANDVRDRIGSLSLPAKPEVEKLNSEAGSVISLFVYSKNNDNIALMRAVNEKIKPKLQRISGVGKIDTVAYLEPQIRIKLEPALLQKYNLNALEIANLIKKQNFKQALGELENDKKNYIIKGYFEATSLKELEDIIVLPGLFLKDIAKIEQDLEDKKQIAIKDLQEGVLLEINKVSRYNALETISNVKNELSNLEKIAGKDIVIEAVYNKSENISKHLYQVIFDMFLGIILTVLIVYLFLRSISATLIACVAIPTSIISTFFLIDLMGYDLNRLTLIALTLSIGIFVDDAIVVIEHIAKKIDEKLPPLQAAYEGISEIGFSVLSISVVLLCVFVPIAYMHSIPGLFFNALGISVASGVVVSFLVAIFLIPSLSARFFSSKKSKFYYKSEPFFNSLEHRYEMLLGSILKHKAKFLLASFVVILLCFFLATRLGLDFLPMEDDSEFQVMIENRTDLSLEAMKVKSLKILQEIKADKRVEYAYLLVGYTDSMESKKAKIYVKLKELSKRDERQPKIVEEYRKKLSYSDLKIRVLDMPKFEGAGVDSPIQFLVLGDDLNEILKASSRAKELLAKNPNIVNIDDDANSTKEELAVFVDRQKATRLGVDLEYLAGVLSYSFSQLSVGNMDLGAFKDEIILSFDKDYKKDIESLKKIQIKNDKGQSLDLESVVSLVYQTNLASINRYNKSTSVKINASNTDISLGEVKKLILDNIDYILGDNSNLSYDFAGFIDLLDETVMGFVMSILLAFVLIYLVLAALYESLILPFVIMVSMPLAFAGTCLGLFLTGNNFSLFVLVAIILLFGMVGKNAILLVDVANKKCKEGFNVDEALIIAGKSRLRAILMTSFAMICAMLPLALSRGSGYEGNSPMAIAVIFGLVSSTILTLLVVPTIFEFAYKLDVKIRKIYQREELK